MPIQKRIRSTKAIIIVVIITIFLHVWAIFQLPVDYDEPIYLQNAFDYASAMRSDDPVRILAYSGNNEHPSFVKLIYSSVILIMGENSTWSEALFSARAVSAFFGILAVLIISLAIDPLAGGLLGVHTLAIKYTSQVYLEAVPHAMTIASVLAFIKFTNRSTNAGRIIPDKWFWLSAAALGVAAASKYSYIPVILIVLGYLAILIKKIKAHWILFYFLFALIAFFLLDIYLWQDPITRLSESLSFHFQYSQGPNIEDAGYPWFQPFIWIFTSSPGTWHPGVFFYYGFDGMISIAALLGIKREWKERRWLVIWLVTGLVFLLIWPTKWPQYALTVTPALCIMGAESFRQFILWAKEQESYWNYLREMLPRPSKWLWYFAGIFLIFMATLYLSAAIKLAVGRVGWSNMTTNNSFLPSDTIYALLPLNEYQMLIGTDNGAALWTKAEAGDTEPTWTIYNMDNSGLIDNHVLSLARDERGNLWFGTRGGVSCFNGDTWMSFNGKSLGLLNANILSIDATLSEQIFVGSLNGASYWDGSYWKPIAYTQEKTVFSITSTDNGNVVWFGLNDGAGMYRPNNNEWTFFPAEKPIMQILVDRNHVVWAATSGAGLARLDGSTWTYYKTSNSDIPNNTVMAIAETTSGIIWVGTAHATTSGGAASYWDGVEWHTFEPTNSGTSAAEVTAIAVQANQVWMGTRTEGIDFLRIGRNDE